MKGRSRVRLWTGREDIYMGTPIATLDYGRLRPTKTAAAVRKPQPVPDPARTLRKDMFLRVPANLVDQLCASFPELNRNGSFPFFARRTVMEFLSGLDSRYWKSVHAYMKRNGHIQEPAAETAKRMTARLLEVLDIHGGEEALAMLKSADKLAEGLRLRGAFVNTPFVENTRKSA